MYSRLGYPWLSTEWIVCSRYWAWLKEGVMMEMEVWQDKAKFILFDF
jgi:hypothetical protein